MGLGLVSDDEFLSQLENVNRSSLPINLTPNGVISQLASPGRASGDVNVPSSLRAVIGETSALDGRSEGIKLASEFGISPSSVSAYKNGATSTASYNEAKPAIKNPIARAKARIASRSRNRILHAINAITDEKLDQARAKDLAGIAKNLAGVVSVMESNGIDPSIDTSKPAIIIFAPQIRKEESFDVIDVSNTEVIS